MLRICWMTALVMLSATHLLADEKSTGAESKMHGMWSVTASEANGEKIELPWQWTFKSNGKANLVDRKAGKQSAFRYKLDASVTPHRIELVYLGPDEALKDYRQLGIWKIDGNQLEMLVNPPNVEDYPAKFDNDEKTKEAFKLVLEKMQVE